MISGKAAKLDEEYMKECLNTQVPSYLRSKKGGKFGVPETASVGTKSKDASIKWRRI